MKRLLALLRLPGAVAWIATGLFVIHRTAVLLSAGDFLYPLEPSEAKNTQIAWDLVSGRFGTEGYDLGSYISNSGSVHHASYSTGAALYWLSSKVFGLGMTSVRAVPLACTATALLLWLGSLSRLFGAASAAVAAWGLLLPPTLLLAFQLTFLGCHPESVLPLAALVAAWMAWMRSEEATARRWLVVFGLCLGYAAIFSYLLWPFLALLLALTLLPPRPQLSRPEAKALAGGIALGLWPLWIILLSHPSALFTYSITENPETTLLQMALGSGGSLALFVETVRENLPYGAHDFWKSQHEAGALWGGGRFESLAYKAMVWGPLVLLPWAWTEREPALRRLALFVSLGPAVVYLWLAFASPWKPNIPVRYLVPVSLLGLSAPGLGLGLGLRAWKEGRRHALLLLVAAVGLQLWLTPPRATEAADAVRLERAEANRDHRYLHYYNLGIGTIWSEQVGDINDLIDVRTAQNEAHSFAGMQAGLWGSGDRLALGEGHWSPPQPSADSLNAGLSEWAERQSYASEEERDDPRLAAQNIGWGLGVRASWNTARVAAVLQTTKERGLWPQSLSVEDAWEGYGWGLGRARAGVSDHPDSLPPSVPEAMHEAVSRGMRDGRALGRVPEAGSQPAFASVRGSAT